MHALATYEIPHNRAQSMPVVIVNCVYSVPSLLSNRKFYINYAVWDIYFVLWIYTWWVGYTHCAWDTHLVRGIHTWCVLFQLLRNDCLITSFIQVFLDHAKLLTINSPPTLNRTPPYV